jgi:ParB family chromosome partitioning protein
MIAPTKRKRQPAGQEPGQRGSALPHPGLALSELDGYQLLKRLGETFGRNQRLMQEHERLFCERCILAGDPLTGAERDKAEELIGMFAEPAPAAAAPIAKHESPPPFEDAEVPGWSQIGVFTVSLLERHPDNRHPSAEHVAAIADSLSAEGQLEPLVLRKLGEFRYQVLSGETRWLAAKQLGWTAIRGRVIECSDARALELLAIFNAKRKDLDAIEKARLIKRLCEPVEQNGGGLTREAAGKIYGLDSAAAASNLVRLLELPEVWRQRVAAGEIAQTTARELLAIRQLPTVLKLVEQQWKQAKAGGWEMQNFATRDNLRSWLQRVVHNHTRRFDVEYWHHSELGNGDFKCMIHKDDIEANRSQLGIVTIEVTERGKSAEVEVATNTELFDELQTQAVKAHLAKKRKKKAEKAGADDCDSSERAEADARKRKADKTKQLNERRAAWRHAWLGQLVAARLNENPEITQVLLCWIAAEGMPNRAYGDCKLVESTRQTAGRMGAKVISDTGVWHGRPGLLGTLAQVKELKDLQAIGKQMAESVLITPDPDHRSPRIAHQRMGQLASRCGIDVAAEWRKAHERQAIQIDEFFSLHNQEQLIALGRELGVSVEKVAGKDNKVAAFLAAEDVPLPKCIKTLEASPAKAAKKGRK